MSELRPTDPRRDFEVTCVDHPRWRIGGLTAKGAKDVADAHDDGAHRGRPIAQTQKRPPEDAGAQA
jgi:hypothetical protein